MPRYRYRTAVPPVDPDHLTLLRYGDHAEFDNVFTPNATPDAKRRALWAEHRDVILADWIAERPGTRPWAWWAFAAPRSRELQARYAGCYFAPNLIDGRRKLSGSGVPVWDHPGFSAVVPHWQLGMPAMAGVDVSAPPVFESERDYLARHGLLLPEDLSA